MSKSTIEELIESAQNKTHQKYLRRGWIIAARCQLRDANKELRKLEKEVFK